MNYRNLIKRRLPMAKNRAIFEVKTYVTLLNVADNELNNSEVLHPDVLEQLAKNLTDDIGIFEITLEEVLEVEKDTGLLVKKKG
jgi:hypothetical protein